MQSRALHHFRSFRRLVAFGWVVVAAGTDYLLRPRHRRTLQSRALWLQSTCRAALRALGISHSNSGCVPDSDSRAAVIVANHLSYVDILILAATTPVVFVAKSEVRRWPVFGWFARMAGTRFVDRSRRRDVVRVGAELTTVLADRVSVVLFLEGTSTDGSTVLPFRSSLLEPFVGIDCPLIPVALRYRVPAPHSAAWDVCYWGDMTLVPHLLNLAGLPRVDATLAWDAPVPMSGDRKFLAHILHAQVVQLYRGLGTTALNAAAMNSSALTPVLSGN